MRVLIIEDEKKTAAFIRKGLQEAGYVVEAAESASAGLTMSANSEFDLIVLDVMLPDGNGMDVSRQLRNEGFKGFILMLTALDSTRDKVRGLDSGADDYLSKPFEFDELLARIRALLRRKEGGRTRLGFEDLQMDLIQRRVQRAGQEIELTQKEFSLLEYFLRNANRPLTRTEIGENVWDVHFDNESNVIDVYVRHLRKKIDEPYPTAKLLHTVTGYGYVLKRGEM
ncbi:MAG TPA: response regulator transcription factor [Bdellovibrionales bacterium]|mgnify:CR=1 FL=1|nr:response regulator transcription factor [Bdellovibrionales bacterium]